MKFTIREIINGVATVDYEDGAWAEIPMGADDTQLTFQDKAANYATKTFEAPLWAIPESTIDGATVTRKVLVEEEPPVLGNNPIQPGWLINRISAYGAPSSQLEFITENGLEAWQEEVKAIKLANPIVIKK